MDTEFKELNSKDSSIPDSAIRSVVAFLNTQGGTLYLGIRDAGSIWGFQDEGDQGWFVIDTDSWDDSIPKLRSLCESRDNWLVAQSNSCFEVWLYYHVFNSFAGDIELNGCSEWKNFVTTPILGGFDSKKHPLLIADAIAHAEMHFRSTDQGIA